MSKEAQQALDKMAENAREVGLDYEPAQQEPVAWRWSESGGVRWFDWTTDWSHYDRAKAMGFPIQYAAPPAQQEPEWYHFVKYGEDCFVPYSGQAPEKATPLYTSPPTLSLAQRKPLKRQQINQMMADAGWQNSALRQADLDKVEKVARAIEAKLKEKNSD